MNGDNTVFRSANSDMLDSSRDSDVAENEKEEWSMVENALGKRKFNATENSGNRWKNIGNIKLFELLGGRANG